MTIRPGLRVAGLAATVGVAPSTVPLRAAYQALDDAGLHPADVSAVIHVGQSKVDGVAAAVRDGLGASCTLTYDVLGGAAGFVAALAVGASLVSVGGVVLVTDLESGGTGSLVLAGGRPAAGDVEPTVIAADAPIRALLASRSGGDRDVLLVAPGASVRCLLD